MAHRFGLFELAIGAAALMAILLLSVVLQRAGLAQPFALAIAIPCSLLVLYPVMRRWSDTELPFSKWAIVALLVALVGLVLDLVVVRL